MAVTDSEPWIGCVAAVRGSVAVISSVAVQDPVVE